MNPIFSRFDTNSIFKLENGKNQLQIDRGSELLWVPKDKRENILLKVDESKLKNNIYKDNLDNPVKPTKSSSGIEIETHEFSSFSAIFSSNCLEFLLRRKNGFQMEIFDKPFAIRYTQFLSSRDLS